MRKAKSVFIPASRCQFRGKDLTGKKFHRLRVVAFAGKGKNRRPYWRCVCKCGRERIVVVDNLKAHRTRSCGCWGSERHVEIHTTHGMFRTPTYATWMAMRQRCSNSNLRGYKDYGGRGISVCDSWRNSFENFLRDMGPRPSLLHSIDRFPDNNGNYEPGNCRWATRLQQYNNRRSSRFLVVRGIRDTVANHARNIGVPYWLMSYFLRKFGENCAPKACEMWLRKMPPRDLEKEISGISSDATKAAKEKMGLE